MNKTQWVYLVVGGLLVWWWFGLRVRATITTPADDISTSYRPAPGGQGLDPYYRLRPPDALTLEPSDSVAYDLMVRG